MKNLVAGLIAFLACLFNIQMEPASAAGETWREFAKLQEGGLALIYGDRYAIWDCWDSAKPTYLYVKEGGWQQVSKASVARVSCPRDFPYRHTYRWTVDVLGDQDADGDYFLEIAVGNSKNRYPALLQEFTSRDDQINSYLCVLKGDC